jgi:hypothetical protein
MAGFFKRGLYSPLDKSPQRVQRHTLCVLLHMVITPNVESWIYSDMFGVFGGGIKEGETPEVRLIEGD